MTVYIDLPAGSWWVGGFIAVVVTIMAIRWLRRLVF